MAIAENDTLFALIGTTYGGDGQSTFGLPDLQGRIPIHQGNGLIIGERSGVEAVTLTTQQIPSHNHVAGCQTGAGSQAPGNGVWAASLSNIYSDAAPGVLMNASTIGSDGGSQPHDNMMPFLTISFIISLFGVFPSQN
jgi:microcystin-dependent protein